MTDIRNLAGGRFQVSEVFVASNGYEVRPWQDRDGRLNLYKEDEVLLPELSPAEAQALQEYFFAQAGVDVIDGFTVVKIDADTVFVTDGARLRPKYARDTNFGAYPHVNSVQAARKWFEKHPTKPVQCTSAVVLEELEYWCVLDEGHDGKHQGVAIDETPDSIRVTLTWVDELTQAGDES